jgi:hypothetical protein
MAQPFVCCAQRAGIEVADMGSARHLSRYQTGAFQHFDVFRSGCQRHAEWLCELPDGLLALHEAMQHHSPRWVTQGVEDSVQLRDMRCLIINHVVEYKSGAVNYQPTG